MGQGKAPPEHRSERTDAVRERGAQPRNAAMAPPRRRALIVVEAFLDELFLHRPAVRVEAGELEVLLELEVDVVLATAVLLDRDHDPVAEALRLVRVELDVDLGDDVVLLVEDQDDVRLVVDRRRAAQVVVAQARGLEALLVGGHDADHRDVLGQGDVLEAVDQVGDLLGLVLRLRDLRHLLQVVDEDHQAPIARQAAVLLDELAHVLDRAGRLRCRASGTGSGRSARSGPSTAAGAGCWPSGRSPRPRPSRSPGSPCGRPGP